MDVTIFIRARNEEDYIRRCLEQIRSQQTDLKYEIFLLDSGSSDDTVSIACEYGAEVYKIPHELFSYARALNFGIAKSRGRYFVPLSAHCVPVNSDWLHELVFPLTQNIQIGASYSRQIAWPDASQPEIESLQSQFPANDSVRSIEDVLLKLKNHESLHEALHFSNASACIRLDILKEIPFRDMPFSEDRAFAYECLRKGFNIFYSSKSMVFHTHYPTFSEFRTVARAAEIAREQINHLVKASLVEENVSNILLKPKTNIWTLQLVKLPLVVLFANLQIILSLLYLIFSHLSLKTWRRYVDFYVSSIGTTIGKLEASWELARQPALVPERANATNLLQCAVGREE